MTELVQVIQHHSRGDLRERLSTALKAAGFREQRAPVAGRLGASRPISHAWPGRDDRRPMRRSDTGRPRPSSPDCVAMA